MATSRERWGWEALPHVGSGQPVEPGLGRPVLRQLVTSARRISQNPRWGSPSSMVERTSS